MGGRKGHSCSELPPQTRTNPRPNEQVIVLDDDFEEVEEGIRKEKTEKGTKRKRSSNIAVEHELSKKNRARSKSESKDLEKAQQSRSSTSSSSHSRNPELVEEAERKKKKKKKRKKKASKEESNGSLEKEKPEKNKESRAEEKSKEDVPFEEGLLVALCREDAPYGQLLRKLGNGDEGRLQLPTVVFCGMKGAGKTSTLERVLNSKFFLKEYLSSLEVRVALRLMFRYSSSQQSYVTVRLQEKKTGDRTVCESHLMMGEQYGVFVTESLYSCLSHLDVTSQARQVDLDHEIQIEIHGGTLPNIDIVEVPGVEEMEGQSSDDTGKGKQLASSDSMELTRRVLEDPCCVVVMVLSACTSDLRSNPLWELFREMKKSPVVALTMIDKSGGDYRFKSRLQLEDLRKFASVKALIPVVNWDSESDTKNKSSSMPQPTNRGAPDNKDTVKAKKSSEFGAHCLVSIYESVTLKLACYERGVQFSQMRHGAPALLQAVYNALHAQLPNMWLSNDLDKWCLEADSRLRKRWSLIEKQNSVPQLQTCIERIKKGISRIHRINSSRWRVEMELPFHFDLAASGTVLNRMHVCRKLEDTIRVNLSDIVSGIWAHVKVVFLEEIQRDQLFAGEFFRAGLDGLLDKVLATGRNAIEEKIMLSTQQFCFSACQSSVAPWHGLTEDFVHAVLYYTVAGDMFLEEFSAWMGKHHEDIKGRAKERLVKEFQPFQKAFESISLAKQALQDLVKKCCS